METKEMIFVVVACFGQYDDAVSINIYAGSDYEMAKVKSSEYKFPDEYNQRTIIETWIEGEMVGSVEHRSF